MLTDIFATLASSPTSGVYSTVVSQSLPKLSSAIRSSTKEESWVASSAIELVGSLVEGAQEGLGDGFFGTVAEGLFNCLNTAEDRDVLQVSDHQSALHVLTDDHMTPRTVFRS